MGSYIYAKWKNAGTSYAGSCSEYFAVTSDLLAREAFCLYKKFESEKQMQLDIMKDVESFHENFEHLKVKTEERRSEVETLKDDLNEVSSRLYGLENLRDNFEGFQEGVKSVMLWQRERQEQLGAEGAVSFQPVAEVVEVPQEY